MQIIRHKIQLHFSLNFLTDRSMLSSVLVQGSTSVESLFRNLFKYFFFWFNLIFLEKLEKLRKKKTTEKTTQRAKVCLVLIKA